MKVSIANILELPVFKNTQVVAGSKGLINQVDRVTYLDSLDNMDNGNPPMKNELIVIPAMLLKLLETTLSEFIVNCYKNKASGICIKTGKVPLEWSSVLPKNIDKVKFPIIILPSNADLPQIVNAVSYEILRSDGYDMRLPFEENFFQELIFTKKDPVTMRKRANMLGIKVDERLGLLLIQPDNAGIVKRICTFCKERWEQRCYTLTKNDRILIVVRINITGDTKEYLLELGNDLISKLSSAYPRVKCQIGIGRCYDDINYLSVSFYEARIALTVGMINHSANTVTHFNDLGIYRILFDLKNKSELYYFFQETLGKIMDYDRDNRTEYVQTIRVYIEQNCSINRTASQLFVHYNSIRYRLKKIKKLFGMDLDHEEDRINLCIAIKIADFFNAESKL
ncbi:MAG: helix-turn-helix domain-containing protein [Syntrophomonas sp.]